MSALFITCEPMLWYYGIVHKTMVLYLCRFVGIVLVLVLVLVLVADVLVLVAYL